MFFDRFLSKDIQTIARSNKIQEAEEEVVIFMLKKEVVGNRFKLQL